jgi:hypothetical protein
LRAPRSSGLGRRLEAQEERQDRAAAGRTVVDSISCALRQYVSILAGQAEIVGIDLDAARSPLVQ